MRQRNVKNKKNIIENSDYVILNPIEYKGMWQSVFNNDNPIYIEIGMGKGNFILENALNNKNINYIGIEKYSSVAAVAIKKIKEYKLDNLKIIINDVSNLEELLKNKVDVIYLNFSDPWPKNRHAKRRLTSSFFLKIYVSVFCGKPHIIQKTDNIGLFASSIVSLSEYGYTIHNCSLDLHNETIENYQTEYEKKFSEKGQKINYLDAVKE